MSLKKNFILKSSINGTTSFIKFNNNMETEIELDLVLLKVLSEE